MRWQCFGLSIWHKAHVFIFSLCHRNGMLITFYRHFFQGPIDVSSPVFFTFGGFLKWGYPQIIHFNRISLYNPSILEYPHLWKPPFVGNALHVLLFKQLCWDLGNGSELKLASLWKRVLVFRRRWDLGIWVEWKHPLPLFKWAKVTRFCLTMNGLSIWRLVINLILNPWMGWTDITVFYISSRFIDVKKNMVKGCNAPIAVETSHFRPACFLEIPLWDFHVFSSASRWMVEIPVLESKRTSWMKFLIQGDFISKTMVQYIRCEGSDAVVEDWTACSAPPRILDVL